MLPLTVVRYTYLHSSETKLFHIQLKTHFPFTNIYNSENFALKKGAPVHDSKGGVALPKPVKILAINNNCRYKVSKNSFTSVGALRENLKKLVRAADIFCCIIATRAPVRASKSSCRS